MVYGPNGYWTNWLLHGMALDQMIVDEVAIGRIVIRRIGNKPSPSALRFPAAPDHHHHYHHCHFHHLINIIIMIVSTVTIVTITTITKALILNFMAHHLILGFICILNLQYTEKSENFLIFFAYMALWDSNQQGFTS